MTTEPGEMAGEINELNAEIKRLNGALRELAIASSESLAEARFDLKASQEALAEALEMHRLQMEKAEALADALRTYHRANRMHNDLEADLYDLSKAALAEWEGK